MRLSLKTRNRNEVNKRIYCAMVFACMFWFIGSLWGIDILSLHKEWKTNYKKKKSLSTTDLCKNTHRRFKLKLTEPRPLPPVTDSTATHHFNWAKKQRTLPSSNVFSVVVILNRGDKVVCSNRRDTGKLSPLTPNRAAAGQCLQETAVESETSGLHEILSGDTEQAACWAAEFLQMEWKTLWSKVSHGAHWGGSPFRTSLQETEMPSVGRSHLGACQHSHQGSWRTNDRSWEGLHTVGTKIYDVTSQRTAQRVADIGRKE